MIGNPIITDTKEPTGVKGVPCQKSSGVAKFINVSARKDVMSFLFSVKKKKNRAPARSYQHTIILIPFVLHLILSSARG